MEDNMLLENLLKMKADDALVYLEQNVNYLFEKDRVSEVPADFLPDNCGEYPMPYVRLSLADPRLHWYEAEPGEYLKDFFFDGISLKFFVHPLMLTQYKEKGNPALCKIAGYEMIAPTASTRTVMTRGYKRNFMVKANMTNLVGTLRRSLKRSAIERSRFIMEELSMADATAPASLAYLPESIGAVYGDEVGMLVREYKARPSADEERYLIPLFSLISRDRKSPNNPLLLSQIIEESGEDPFQAFIGCLIMPLLESWSYLLFDQGFLPVVHFQNTLLEIDKNGKPMRIVFRDLQDINFDNETRQEKNLRTILSSHLANDVTHRTMILDGQRIDDPQLARRIRYSLNYDFWAKRLFGAFAVVMSKYLSCREERIVRAIKEIFVGKNRDKIEHLFPVDQYDVIGIDENNPRVRFIKNCGGARYR